VWHSLREAASATNDEKARLRQTKPPNALPAAWRYPGQHKDVVGSFSLCTSSSPSVMAATIPAMWPAEFQQSLWRARTIWVACANEATQLRAVDNKLGNDHLMKINQPAIWALAVSLLSILPNSAQAFYNPQTGHWLSRDRIGTMGGLNEGGFTFNSPVNAIDSNGKSIIIPLMVLAGVTTIVAGAEYAHLQHEKQIYRNEQAGIFTAPDGHVDVTIKKCEVMVYIGHGGSSAITDSPHFNFPVNKNCPSAVGFMGCNADDISDQITRDGTLLTGSPTGAEWHGAVTQNLEQWKTSLNAMTKGFINKVNSMLQTSCCSSVKFIYKYLGNDPVVIPYTAPLPGNYRFPGQ